jgi:F0F1-type ATP synthase assembly protein I
MPDPSPAREPQPKKPQGALAGLVHAERMLQIAVILPAAVVVGWIGGAALDRWLHQDWIYLAGIVLGAVAGFIQMIRLVFSEEKQIEKEDR